MMRRLLVLLMMLICFCFLACNNGGKDDDKNDGDDKTNPDQSALSGTFLRAKVSGVKYRTETQSGVVGPDGQFKYQAGEKVRFFVGDTLLGEVEGKKEISAFDLSGTQPISGTNLAQATIDDPKSPFQVLINLEVFLQTFDHDGNPANGIVIDKSVAALFSGVVLNFHQGYESFLTDMGFRGALNKANLNQLFTQLRIPRTPWDALDLLYQEENLDDGLYARGFYWKDSNNNGVAEFVMKIRYDAKSRPINYEIFTGTKAYSELFYDSRGLLIEKKRTWQNTHITVEQYGYNEGGELISVDEYPGGLGEVHRTISYNAYGRILEDQEINSYPDVGYNDRTVNTYDVRNRLVRKERRISYWVVDMPNVRIENFDYDENTSQLVRVRIDADGDGTIDKRREFEYNGNGAPVTIEVRRIADDSLESKTSYEYDGNGRMTRMVEDSDGDGAPNKVIVKTYHANGALKQVNTDEDGNGFDDTLLFYDDRYNPVRLEKDQPDDGRIDHVAYYELDVFGNRVRTDIDYKNDGTTDEVIVEKHVPSGWRPVFVKLEYGYQL